MALEHRNLDKHEAKEADLLGFHLFGGMFVIFISHQWLGTSHPDPLGQQMAVLRSALSPSSEYAPRTRP